MEMKTQLMIVLLCGVLAILSSLVLKNYTGILIVAGALAFVGIAWLIISRRGTE